jgi:hypothetical protein
MSWANKRKLIYIGSFVGLVVIIAGWIFMSYFYKAPTCFDKKQNQNEAGVDCGGPCTLLCPAQYAPLNVLWSRFAKVSDGVYNVLAYIENPNINAGAKDLDYVFKLYDKDGILLRERYGRTFAPANKILAVFEADLQTGNQVPQRVEFSFLTKAVWLKQASQETGLSVSQPVISRVDTAPRLTAVMANKTINPIRNVEAVAVIYNASGNTIAFSRTVVEAVAGKAEQNLNFNWPKPFSQNGQPESPARTEIIFKILN